MQPLFQAPNGVFLPPDETYEVFKWLPFSERLSVAHTSKSWRAFCQEVNIRYMKKELNLAARALGFSLSIDKCDDMTSVIKSLRADLLYLYLIREKYTHLKVIPGDNQVTFCFWRALRPDKIYRSLQEVPPLFQLCYYTHYQDQLRDISHPTATSHARESIRYLVKSETILRVENRLNLFPYYGDEEKAPSIAALLPQYPSKMGAYDLLAKRNNRLALSVIQHLSETELEMMRQESLFLVNRFKGERSAHNTCAKCACLASLTILIGSVALAIFLFGQKDGLILSICIVPFSMVGSFTCFGLSQMAKVDKKKCEDDMRKGYFLWT